MLSSYTSILAAVLAAASVAQATLQFSAPTANAVVAANETLAVTVHRISETNLKDPVQLSSLAIYSGGQANGTAVATLNTTQFTVLAQPKAADPSGTYTYSVANYTLPADMAAGNYSLVMTYQQTLTTSGATQMKTASQAFTVVYDGAAANGTLVTSSAAPSRGLIGLGSVALGATAFLFV